MATISPRLRKKLDRAKFEEMLKSTIVGSSLNTYQIVNTLNFILSKNKELNKIFKIQEVKSDYNQDNSVFRIEMTCPKKDRHDHLIDLEEALTSTIHGSIIPDADFDIFKSGLAEKGHTALYSYNSKAKFTQKPMLGFEKPPKKSKRKFYEDENAYVPPLFFAKKDKRKPKGKQIESELVPDLTPDYSPGTEDNMPQETSFDEVSEKPSLARDIKDIAKEAADDLEKRKHAERLRDTKSQASTTTFARDIEVRERILNGGTKKPKSKTKIDYEKVEEVEPTRTSTKKFGLDYVLITKGKNLLVDDFVPLSAKYGTDISLTKTEIERVKQAVTDGDVDSIELNGKKVEIIDSANLSAVVVYHGNKPTFPLWNFNSLAKKGLKKIEDTYYEALEKFDGRKDYKPKDAIRKTQDHFDTLEDKISKRKKTTAAVGGLALLLSSILLGGFFAYFLPKPDNGDNGNGNGDTNHTPTLDVGVPPVAYAGEDFVHSIFTNDIDNDTVIITDNSPIFDIHMTGKYAAELRGTPTEANIGEHIVKINAVDEHGKSVEKDLLINITKKPIVPTDNLPPELVDAYIEQLTKTDYQLVVKAKDKAGDDYPGYQIEALLDGKVIGLANDSDLVKLLNITDSQFAIGDNQIDILLKDKHNVSLKETKALFLHKNIPPVVGLEVEKLTGDNYKLKIDANSFDDNIKNIQIYVGDELYKEINPNSSHATLEEDLNLTKFIGDKTIKVIAEDEFGDFDEASETVTTQNDPTQFAIDFQEPAHEHWYYLIGFDGIDNKIAKVEVKSPELNINQVFTPNEVRFDVGDDFNLTNALPGTYDVNFELTDDLDETVSEQRTVVLDNDGTVCIYNVSNNNDQVTVKIDLDDSDTKISELDVEVAKDTNITNPNNKVVHYEHTFDVSGETPGETYATASITDELGAEQELFNVSVNIHDDLSHVEDASASYNPLDDIVHIYDGIASDDDTVLEDVLYKLRDSGNNVVKEGSLNPVDDNFDELIEDFNGTIDTSGLLEGDYTLEITPKSNGVDGTLFTTQIQINHTYEIVPVWNEDLDAENGQLDWNFTSGKADLLLEGNNTYFDNYLDEWNAVDPDLQNAVKENWTTVVVTDDPFATATNVQGKVRDIHGFIFSDAETYNSTREQFVACMEYIKNDTMNNASISQADKDKWNEFFVTNIAVHDGGVGDWRENTIYSYFGNSTVQRAYFTGVNPMDYSFVKNNLATITEYDEYKIANGQTQTDYEAKRAIEDWGKYDINWSDVDINEDTIKHLISLIDNPTQINQNKLQIALQTIDTYQKEKSNETLRIREVSGEYKFYNA